MSEFERQHPVAAVSRAFGLIRGNIVTILVFLFVGAQSDNFPFLWWIGGLFIFLLIIGAANWWRFLYKMDGDTLHIRSGIFVRKDLYLTKDRIQVIDISSGVIQRLFGLVRLDIQTAGATSRQAAIDAITKVKAMEINRVLRDIHSDPGEFGQVSEEIGISDSDVLKKLDLPHKELLIAASTSGSFGIALSVLATIFSQIEPLISESEMFEYLFSIIPSQTDAVMIGITIFIFIAFAWLLSFFSTLFTYGNFKLIVKEKEIIISRGIFEKKRVTIPYNRIQAIHVSEGLIRQPLGYASIHLESAGYGDEKGTGSIVLFPLIRRTNIIQLLNDVLPDYEKEMPGIKPPSRALRRYIFKSSFPITIVTGVLFWYLSLNLWIWLIPIGSLFWGWLKYKDAALAWGEDILLFRSRQLSKSTAYIKKKRVQDAIIFQNVFQRYRNLCSVQIHVASGDRGKSFMVDDLEYDEGIRLLNAVRKNGISAENRIPEETLNKIQVPGWI
tara:strand:- start:19161 stop:20657 length:1497 start_codon:yes stop_codon:yes gene_type:complete